MQRLKAKKIVAPVAKVKVEVEKPIIKATEILSPVKHSLPPNSNLLSLVSCLRVGTYFEIPTLKETMRNLQIVGLSETATLVEGLKRESILEKTWTPFRDRISNMVQVVINHNPAPIKISEIKIENGEEKVVKKTSGKRGRQKMIFDLQVPKKQFIMKEFFELNAANNPTLTPSICYLRIQEMLKNKKVKIVGHRKNDSGRGKSLVIYAGVK